MARLPRLSIGGLPHLVLLRGLEHRPVVADDDDRLACVAALRDASRQRAVAVHGYALLDDRVRLLATPPDAAALGRMMQDFGRRYVAGFNRRHGRRGPLWDGRFRATVVQPGTPALEALLFVDGEPARTGTVEDASRYRWSSAMHHAGHSRDPLVSMLGEYWQLGNTPFDRESAYRRQLSDGLSPKIAVRLEQACEKGWAVGDAAFLAQLSAQTQRPLQPRAPGRPPKRG